MPDAAASENDHQCPIPAAGPVPPTMAAPFLPQDIPRTDIGKKPAARVREWPRAWTPRVHHCRRSTVLFLCGRKKNGQHAHGGMIKAGWGTVDIGGPQFVCPFRHRFIPWSSQSACLHIKARLVQSQALFRHGKLSGNAIRRRDANSIENSGKP